MSGAGASWRPLPVDEVASLFRGAPFRWWISGALALVLHVGADWREHSDTDVGIVRDEAPLVWSHLAAWDCRVAAGGHLSPWGGRELDAAAHENNVWVREDSESPFAFDLTVGEGNLDHWVYRRDPAVARPWPEAVLVDRDGVPYLAPELQLLFKSKAPRPKDHVDAGIVIPTLSDHARLFLSRRLPDRHPWRKLLA